MAEESGVTLAGKAYPVEAWEGQRRADRLEGVLRQALRQVFPTRDVSLLVLDMGKGECLVALRHPQNLVQIRFWRELVDEVLANPDAAIQHVLGRIVLGALAP